MRSSTRGLALLGALLLGGGMVAWIVRDPGGPRLQAPPARKHADPQAAAADARASAESAPARPNASIASTREVMAAADSAELDPRLLPAAVAALPLADGGHDGVELVVLAPDRSPVAHATVLWCRAAEGAAPTFATLRDSTQLTAAGAVRLATDPAGRCRLPRTLDPATAFAFAAGGRGAVRLAPATFFPVELLIEPPFVVEVQVADAGGAAQAGVEVGFGPKDGDPFQPAVSATTGADGIARFADLDLELLGMRLPRRSEEATASRRAGGEWLVAIRGVVGSGVRQRVTLPPDPPATAAAPLRVALTLPPAGGVTFTVRGADDRPLADGAISFQARGPAGAEVSGALLCEDDGTVRVAPVELGWTARIEASAPGHARVRRDIDGPRRAGEVVAIELLLPPTQLRIRGRAIAADGRPLPGLPLSVAGSAVGVDSGADGSFEFDGAGLAQGDRRERDRRRKRNAATTPPADNRRALFVLTAADPHAPSHEALVEFTLPERGVLDLGAIRFEARPLLAAGRVVDETGAPLADTHVAAAVDRPSAWIAEQGDDARITLSMKTGADGLFTLHARAAGPVFQLFAHRSGLLRLSPLEIAPGSRDVELVLRRGGSCEASLRADGALPPRWFVARLEESGGSSSRRETPGRLGHLRWELLPVGTHDFVLAFAGWNKSVELLRVPGIEIVAEALTLDPRLQGIDPAAFVPTTTLVPLALDGSIVTEGRVLLGDEEQPNREQQSLGPRGLTVPFFGETTRMTLHADGFRVARVNQRIGRIDLPLEPAPSVTLILTDWSERDDGRVPVRLELRPHDRLLRELDWRGRAALTDGAATLRLPAFGRYDVEVRLAERGADGRWRDARVESPRAGTIELTADGSREFKVKEKRGS